MFNHYNVKRLEMENYLFKWTIKCLENVYSANVVEKYLRITAFKLHQLQAAVPDTFPALEHDDCVSSEEMNGGHRAISPLDHAHENDKGIIQYRKS